MRRHAFQRRQQGKRGFVLMLTLAMIVIAVTLTARTANRSLTRTLESIDAEFQLRDRWSRLSLQQSVLLRAEQIFAYTETDQRDAQPIAWHDADITLAGTTYHLRLADENAKINLNVVRRTQTHDAFQQLIRQTTPRSIQTSLQTPNSSDQPIDSITPLESWGQVFPSPTPSHLVDATTNVTLWGNGRLNIHRATDQSIRQLLANIVSSTEIDAILRQRRDSIHRRNSNESPPHGTLTSDSVDNYLTGSSLCHSLWIVTPATGPIELHIREAHANGARITSFRW